MILALFACSRVCGTVELTIANTGAELYDTDGDGRTNLTEQCGVIGGSFGSRRRDFGVTELIFDAAGVNGEIDFAVTTYVLPVASITFLTENLAVGSTLTGPQLAGAGLHIPEGEPSAGLANSPFSEGWVEILDRRPTRNALDEDDEDLRLAWQLHYGGDAQFWQGEDWLTITNGIEIGRPLHIPTE